MKNEKYSAKSSIEGPFDPVCLCLEQYILDNAKILFKRAKQAKEKGMCVFFEVIKGCLFLSSMEGEKMTVNFESISHLRISISEKYFFDLKDLKNSQ